MKLLKTILVMNGASCVFFGLLFLITSGHVNTFIGNSVDWLVPVVGGALLVNGIHLLFASKRPKPVCPEILYFVVGDFLWVISSFAFIGLGIVITTLPGIISAVVVSLMVGFFGAMQVVSYKILCRECL